MPYRLSFLLLFISILTARAQSADSAQAFHATIRVIGVFRGDSVVLRWAPETPGAWSEIRKVGFTVSRTPLDDNGSFDPNAFQVLTPQPLKPWPLEQWATIASQDSKDDYAKIAAQALYGESFKTSSGFIPAADEYVTRFSFAMLAADLSAPAATAMGLRFVDKTAVAGKVYLYRIESAVPTEKYTVLPGITSVNAVKETIPAPVIEKVNEKEGVIELVWNRDYHDIYFSAYYIERSDDNGRTFRRLNNLPYIHPAPEDQPDIPTITYLDSVKTNYKTFQYRLVGLTPFAEVSPASKPIIAMGRDRTPPPPPSNVSAKHIGGSSVEVKWEFPKKADVKGFLIGRGQSPKDFTPLVTDPLPASTRSFVDKNADVMASNFYIVAAVDTAGNASLSIARYAMIIDSIPPAPPVNLTGKIDTAGHVTVKWSLGQEKDIKGYLVFFANSPDHEFSQLTNHVLQDTVFQDTITLKTLTKKIYYRVVAVDYNMNYSGFSETLVLKKPDVIPPSAAVFDRYTVSEKGILLNWMASSSEDLATSVLQRRESKTQDWFTVATFGAGLATASYQDTTGLEHGHVYTYSILSVDEDSLTRRSVPVNIRFIDLKQGTPVTSVFATPQKTDGQILLNWTYPVNGEYRFVLYRAVNGSPFLSYKSLTGTTTTFIDKDVREGSSYEYAVGVIFRDGRKAPFGKIVQTAY